MNTSRFLPWALGFCLACLVPATQAEEAVLKKATFTHGLTDTKAPKDTAESFGINETVYLSLELKGRPKSGVVAATFLFRDSLIAEAKVDVATVNKGVIFSFGESTFVGFDVTHEKPLPVGDCYTAEVTFDDKQLGKFPFKVAPPKDAIPSKMTRFTLAKGTDEQRKPVDETREFGGEDKVFLVGVADLGLASWLEATWKVGGKVDEAGTRSFTMEENKKDVPFSFSFIPAGGWPAGEHEVAVVLDGKEVANEKFTVKAGAPMAAAKLEIDSSQLFRDDGKGEAGKEVTKFTTDDTAFFARWNLKEKTLVKGVEFDWVLVDAGGEKDQLLVTAKVEAAVNNQISTSLTARKGLPAGKYRIDLVQDDKVIDRKEFEVK